MDTDRHSRNSFQGGPDQVTQTQGKREKSSGMKLKEEREGPGHNQTHSGSLIEKRLKPEVETSDKYETDGDDVQDEMPLAKRRSASDARQ
jgi:hypothetical protein